MRVAFLLPNGYTITSDGGGYVTIEGPRLPARFHGAISQSVFHLWTWLR